MKKYFLLTLDNEENYDSHCENNVFIVKSEEKAEELQKAFKKWKEDFINKFSDIYESRKFDKNLNELIEEYKKENPCPFLIDNDFLINWGYFYSTSIDIEEVFGE